MLTAETVFQLKVTDAFTYQFITGIRQPWKDLLWEVTLESLVQAPSPRMSEFKAISLCSGPQIEVEDLQGSRFHSFSG